MTHRCECGCGNAAPIATVTDPTRGWVRGESLRFIHGHVGRLQSRNIRGRLLAKVIVDVDGPTPVDGAPCWLWIGRSSGGGYGQIGYQGRTVYTHRLAYELWFGIIPASPRLDVDHLCRVRLCINPSHLELVTHKVNVHRGVSAGAVNAAKTRCKRGHLFDEANTYISPDGKHRECRACREGRQEYQATWHADNKNRRNADRRAGRLAVKLGEAQISCSHGRSGYTSGCRCPECTTANADYERTRRAMYGAVRA